MTLLLVDFSAVFLTNWHGTADQNLSEAAKTTVRQILGHAERYEHAALCLDSPKSFRRELYPEYKKNREDKPRAMIAQLQRTIEKLLRKGLRGFVAEGYEGDDIIATMCSWAATEGMDMDVVILGADKDLYQLLGPSVEILNHATGKLFGVDDLLEKAGVHPHQIPDYLAICGDKADNIPGIPGLGPKWAAEHLQRHGCLAAILDHARAHSLDFTPAKLTALQEHGTAAMKALELTRLRDDAPIACATVLRAPEPIESAPRVTDEIPAEGQWDEEQVVDYSDDRIIEAPASAPQTKETEQMAEPAKSEPQQKPKPKPKALAKVEPQQFAMTLEPRDMRQAWWLAQKVTESRLFFKKFESPEGALVAIMAGRELGLGVVSSMLNVHVIEGAPSYHAHLIIARALQHPACEYFQLVETSATSATYETKRKGSPQPTRLTYTIEQAEAAGLTRPSRNGKPSNWVRIPAEMCRKSAGVQLARAVYPDATRGMYAPEELSGEEPMEIDYEVAQ